MKLQADRRAYVAELAAAAAAVYRCAVAAWSRRLAAVLLAAMWHWSAAAARAARAALCMSGLRAVAARAAMWQCRAALDFDLEMFCCPLFADLFLLSLEHRCLVLQIISLLLPEAPPLLNVKGVPW
jgi:hypothetical protein